MFSIQDEVLAISDKVVIRADDLVSWYDEKVKWSWGLKGCNDVTSSSIKEEYTNESTEQNSEENLVPARSLKQSQVDFAEVEVEKGMMISMGIFSFAFK